MSAGARYQRNRAACIARARRNEQLAKARDPERWRAQSRAKSKRWRDKQTPEQRKRLFRKGNLGRYGVTPEQYDTMYAAQGGVCAICKGGPDGRWKRLHVDHDHDTKKVRALLCGMCNISLGGFRHQPDLLRAAIAYLERHSLTITFAAA